MRTILIVEDELLTRKAVARCLRAGGFLVIEASSAATAVCVNPLDIDAALLDLELGDGLGTDVAASLRGARPDLPIAFFTGGAIEAVLRLAQTFGPVFAKPDLVELIAWLGPRAAGVGPG